jgi:hypothetical protein
MLDTERTGLTGILDDSAPPLLLTVVMGNRSPLGSVPSSSN